MEEEAAMLIAELRRHGGGLPSAVAAPTPADKADSAAAAAAAAVAEVAGAAPRVDGVPTAREARLAREVTQLRQWVDRLERRVGAARAAPSTATGKLAANDCSDI